MIVGNIDEGFDLVCAICDRAADPYFTTWSEAFAHVQDPINGWHSKRLNVHWQDICPECWAKLHKGDK